MAEKIDKNEYVDNSKVFFDFLLHTHQWSNITPVEYAKWLSNFNDIPDGQYIACRLLNRFLYYSDKDIKKLLVDAINDVYSQQVVLPLQLSKDFSSLPSENEYEINEAIKRTLFIPLTPWGDPGASGLYIMRCIHNYYKPRVQSCHVSEVIDSMSAPYDRIVIVDDFVGSGEQFADFWETAEIKDGTLLRDWCCSHQIQANYLALIGYEKTLTELESRFSDINISFAEVLDESYLNHGDIVINRIGRCAGYWSVYTGMQKLISDCLIVVKEPSDATIEALRNHSENGRLQIPLRGVSTPYITIDDVRSLLLNN